MMGRREYWNSGIMEKRREEWDGNTGIMGYCEDEDKEWNGWVMGGPIIPFFQPPWC